MRAEQLRAHAVYCQARMQAAPDAASRRRWQSEYADWLKLELDAARSDRAAPLFSLAEPRSFQV
jgi:hypothetical protein